MYGSFNIGCLLSPLLAKPFLATSEEETNSECYGVMHEVLYDNSSSIAYNTSDVGLEYHTHAKELYRAGGNLMYVNESRSILKNVTHSLEDALTLQYTQIWKAFIIAGSILFFAFLCSLSLYIFDNIRKAPGMKSTDQQGNKTVDKRNQSPLVRFLILQMAMFIFIACCMQRGVLSYLFAYAVHCRSWQKGQAALLKTAYQSGAFAALLLSMILLIRVRPQVLLTASCLGSVASLLALTLAGNKTVIMWLGTVVLGLCMGPIYGLALSWGNQHFTVGGKVGAIFTVSLASSDILGSLVINLLYGRFGLATYIYYSLTITILMNVILLSIFITIRCKGSRGPIYSVANRSAADPTSKDTGCWNLLILTARNSFHEK